MGSEARTRLLVRMHDEKLWPVQGGVFMEVNGAGSYVAVLAAVADDSDVKIYDFDRSEWLIEKHPSSFPAHRLHNALEALEGIDESPGWQLRCDVFITIVEQGRVRPAVSLEVSQLRLRSVENTKLGELVRSLLGLDDLVASYNTHLEMTR
jgi:hypothetical protein